MTQVAYEKGALFLTELERAFGRDRFDAFLLDYFDRHAFQSDHDRRLPRRPEGEAVPARPGGGREDRPGRLGRGPGPEGARSSSRPPAGSTRSTGPRPTGRRAATPAAIAGDQDWSTQEWLRFLRALPATIPPDRMAELDAAFGLTGRGNAEIAAQWLLIAIRNGYRPADARLEAFLTSIGRRKFLMPLYRELIKTPEGKARALAIYARARPFYHPIAVESVDKLLVA